jgi:hypothetical protein
MTRYTMTTIFLISFVGGMVFFALHHDWIIIRSPFSQYFVSRGSQSSSIKQTIKVWYWNNDKKSHEIAEILWDDQHETHNAQALATAYFSLLSQEGIIEQKISIESASIPHASNTLYLSLTQSPFAPNIATHKKLQIVEGLLQTLAEHLSIKQMQLLSHHHPLLDYHLDFSLPWPTEGFIASERNAAPTITPTPSGQKYVTLMLDPAGDAQYTARVIDGSFERGISLQCAQALQESLEAKSRIRVVLTRAPGETIEPLQNAAFANRLNADVFISLGMYQTTTPLPVIHFYHFGWKPDADFVINKKSTVTFDPYHQAHQATAPTSALLVYTLVTQLKNTQTAATVVSGIQCPYRPLVGIKASACAIELGLRNRDDWRTLVEPLALQIITTLEQLGYTV